MESPKLIGFLQAMALVAYVFIFTLIMQAAQWWLSTHNFQFDFNFFVFSFLIAFVISALICGLIMFAVPVWMILNHQRALAAQTFLWSLGWLLIITLCLSVFAIASHPQYQEIPAIHLDQVAPQEISTSSSDGTLPSTNIQLTPVRAGQ